ncbi:Cyclic nucleotide-binding domain-containing protein [Aphelenchoides besseyi]|nr:Cyclic nucleotide-binding domain-containing protein [Aphelenchoides besseyi]
MDVEKHYQDAVAKLNGLQSNAKTIAEMREKRQEMAALNMKETHFYMKALGITVFTVHRIWFMYESEYESMASQSVKRSLRHDSLKFTKSLNIQSPLVTGITTLDIDHTSILGSTIAEIAWHKAGIMKPKTPCFTVPQSSEAWEVFEKRAAERSTSIRECVSFDEYKWSSDVQKYVEEHGQHHKFNIALAVELAKTWLKTRKHYELSEMNGSGDRTKVNKIVEQAILETKWMGRSQVLKNGNITYHLDGAHTPKSIQYCADWFSYGLKKRADSSTGLRILIFHCTADRDPMTLLPILTNRIRFDLALFCPTRLVPVLDPRNDNTNLNQSEDEQWKKCLRARDTWKTLTNTDKAETYVCINDCVKRVHLLAENNVEVQVLVTVTVNALYNIIGCSILIFEECLQFYSLWLILNAVSDMINLLDVFVQSRVMYLKHDATLNDWVYSPAKIPNLRYANCDARYNVGYCTMDESNRNFWKRDLYIDDLRSYWENRFNETDFGVFTRKYTLSFYWSALTLTTLGEQPWPNNSPEMIFETIDTIVGLLLFAIILGQIGSMVSHINAARTQFEEVHDGCKRFMNYRRVESSVQSRVFRFLDFSGVKGQTMLSEEEVANSLPPRLHSELTADVHLQTFRDVEMFADCEISLLTELAQKLQLQIFCPGDEICRNEDAGKALFIVKCGRLNLMDERESVSDVLTSGRMFGEVAVLNPSVGKQLMKHHVRSIGYSELYVLTREDLWLSLNDYPDCAQKVMKKATATSMATNFTDECNRSCDSEDKSATFILTILDDLASSQRMLSFFFNGYLTLFCVCSGVLLNSLCIFIFLRFRQGATSIIQYYLITLTAWQSALLLSAFFLYCLPTLIFGRVVNFGFYAQFYPISYVFANASHTGCVWIAVVLTVDRYLALCRPLKHPAIGKKLLSNELDIIGNLSNCQHQIERTVLTQNVAYWTVYHILLQCLFITVVPCFIICALTCQISFALRNAGKRRKSLCQVTSGEYSLGSPRGSAESGKLKNNDHRSNVMLVLIIAKFLIANLLPTVADVLEHDLVSLTAPLPSQRARRQSSSAVPLLNSARGLQSPLLNRVQRKSSGQDRRVSEDQFMDRNLSKPTRASSCTATINSHRRT